MSDDTAPLLKAIFHLVRELPGVAVQAIARELEAQRGPTNRRGLQQFGATATARAHLGKVGALAAAAGLPSTAVALALESSAYTLNRVGREELIEIAWTGPSTEAVPLRRVDQVLYELIAAAKTEVVLVTYAAYKADRALAALRDASERGVRVTLVIEPSEESQGRISFDALESIRNRVPDAMVLYWPLAKRPGGDIGTHGTMHVKCLIADQRAALVSSANLTDRALELNMELGAVLRGEVASRLARHYEQLIARGELVPIGQV